MKKLSLLLTSLFLMVLSVRAETPSESLHLEFGEPTISVEENFIIPQVYEDLALAEVQSAFSGITLGQMVVMGKQLWSFIVKNQPVINLKTNVAHVVPEGIQAWNALSGWKQPKSYIYKVEYTNAYGANVVDLQYNVLFTPGGSYNGQGQYLANVTILPSVEASWGYTVDAQVNIHKAVNVGTDADPIASALMDIQWKVSTVMKKSVQTQVYSVNGNGEFLGLN